MISLIVAVAYFNFMFTAVEYSPGLAEKARVNGGIVTTIGIEAESDIFFARILTDTFTFPGEASFRPFFVTYSADVGIKYGDFRAGIKHSCSHTIGNGGYEDDYPVYGASEQFYIQGKFTVYK